MAKKKKKSAKRKKTGDGIIPQAPVTEITLSLDDTEHGSDSILSSGHDSKCSIPGDVVVDVPLLNDDFKVTSTEFSALEISDDDKVSERKETTAESPPSSLSQDTENNNVELSVMVQTKQWGILPDDDSSDEEIEPNLNEEIKGLNTSEKEDRALLHISHVNSGLEEIAAAGNSNENHLDLSPITTPLDNSQRHGSAEQVVINNDNDSSSDSESDDDVPITPYLLKKQYHNISRDVTGKASTDDSVERIETVSMSKKKKKVAPPPPKVNIDEDNYNIEDRGVRSGNMYLQNIRKEEEEREANRDARLFRPAVAARLANVKTDLESRVIAANRAREEEEKQLQRRRSSTSGIEWSYLKKEKELEEERIRKQQEAEERRLMTKFDADSSISNDISDKTWCPAVVSKDTDSESDSSDGDDDIIVPRNYGV